MARHFHLMRIWWVLMSFDVRIQQKTPRRFSFFPVGISLLTVSLLRKPQTTGLVWGLKLLYFTWLVAEQFWQSEICPSFLCPSKDCSTKIKDAIRRLKLEEKIFDQNCGRSFRKGLLIKKFTKKKRLTERFSNKTAGPLRFCWKFFPSIILKIFWSNFFPRMVVAIVYSKIFLSIF